MLRVSFDRSRAYLLSPACEACSAPHKGHARLSRAATQKGRVYLPGALHNHEFRMSRHVSPSHRGSYEHVLVTMGDPCMPMTRLVGQ